MRLLWWPRETGPALARASQERRSPAVVTTLNSYPDGGSEVYGRLFRDEVLRSVHERFEQHTVIGVLAVLGSASVNPSGEREQDNREERDGGHDKDVHRRAFLPVRGSDLCGPCGQ